MHSHAAELTELELQQLTVRNEPTHEDNYNPLVQTPQLTISILKKGLEMVEDEVKHLFYIDHFKDRWLKFKHMCCQCAVQRGVRKHTVKQRSGTSPLSLRSLCSAVHMSFTIPKHLSARNTNLIIT
jgi:hypothetical protein